MTSSSSTNDHNDSNLAIQRKELTPDSGFSLVGIDFLVDAKGELYEIQHYDAYQDALNAKKSRDRPEEYLILYRDAEGNYCHR